MFPRLREVHTTFGGNKPTTSPKNVLAPNQLNNIQLPAYIKTKIPTMGL